MSPTEVVIPLPERPNLEQMRKRAKELASEHGIKLSEAQFNMAKGYGFASWPKLKAFVEMVQQYTRTPDVVEDRSAPGNAFLAVACLNYAEMGPVSMDAAVHLLASDASLRDLNVWTAAAAASPEGVKAHLSDANAQGGPFDWEPLLYLAFSRVPASERDVLATATALLDAGADPNVGYLWYGYPTPFTPLTGALGGGEADQPKHNHSLALARLLLERGANPNDSQALYNRQFRPGTDHLELLLDFGLGTGDGGVWQARLGDKLESPFAMVQHQLRYAIHQNHLARVRLFAERDVDLHTPFDRDPGWAVWSEGRTPAEWAALCGQAAIVDELAKFGAAVPPMSPADQLIGAILGYGDVERIAGAHPDAEQAARAARPSLVVQAARTGRTTAVGTAVTRGFDVNALGRADAPCEMPWQTALHTAVEHNDASMVRWLLQLGADPSIEDARFHATPKGWAEHFGNTEVAALLP